MRVRLIYGVLSLFLIPLVSPAGHEEEVRKSADSRRSGLSAVIHASPSIFIMDKGAQPVPRMIGFMLEHNRALDTVYLKRLITIYIRESELEGINYEVAFCQMCLETGFLRFDGSVSRFQNNFCGLGAINAFTAGDWFGSMEEGIRAHIQHLKAYASIDSLKGIQVDKRFYHVRRGTVFTVFDLTGRWASDPRYGEKIDYLLRKLYKE